LHTARSRNEQIAVDMRLWLRDAIAQVRLALDQAVAACLDRVAREGDIPLPGYTHLRRAMPSSLSDFFLAHSAALRDDTAELDIAARRIRRCPLGSGSGYGLPVALARDFVAAQLGFEAPEEPVTLVQHARGRAELSYLNALEAIALDIGKLAADLWLFTAEEFGYAKLPIALTTGSSLMPQKRNPDLIELLRAHSRQVVTERDQLRETLRDLPSGYHRDFQLLKGPLFRAHDRIVAMLPMVAKLVRGVEFDTKALRAACADPKLGATARVLDRAREGMAFRDAYREEAEGG
jgi:argininosuccinate lyase